MKLKTILTIAAVILLLNGAEALLAPKFFVSQMGLETNALGLIVLRSAGAAQIIFAILFWVTRKMTNWEALQPIVLTGFMLYFSSSILNAYTAIALDASPTVWIFGVGVSLLFSVFFGYFLIIKKEA